MKIKPYVDKLNNSKEFKDFSKKYKDSFMMAGFFILDLESGKNVHQIDYYVPSEKKIAAFSLDKGVVVQLLDGMNSKVPEQLDMKTNIDLEALPGILEDEMKNRNITEDIKKVIAILQTLNGKKIWNLNCILSGMELLRAHIEDESKSVLKMERTSMMDIIKRISPQELKNLQAQQGMPQQSSPIQMQPQVQPDQIESQPQQSPQKPSKEAVAQQIQNLNKLEGAIEKEKKRLKEAIDEKPSKTKAKKDKKK